MPAELEIGSQLAGYRIEELIARGGMGVVYRATEIALERPIALKLIAPELAADERFRERFLRESRLAASTEHPSILPIHAAGEAEGTFFIAMRYIEGTDLRALLESERALEPPRSLAILAPVADALDAAHARGLVHRDVKPGNILLDRAGHAYLCDFGLTKQVSSISGLTGTGQIVGTLDYLAPEQIRGDAVDGRADQYSLACVLYECLAGEPPFKRKSEAQVLWAHMHEEPPPLANARIDAALRRALAKEPDRRYGGCTELIAAIRGPITTISRRRRWGRLLVALGVVSVAGAGAAAFLVTRGGGEKRPPARPVAVAPNSVAVIDARTGRVVSDVPLANGATRIGIGAGAAWVANQYDRTVTRIDLRARPATRTLGAGLMPTDVAVGEGGVWVLDAEVNVVKRLDPAYLTFGPAIRFRRLPPTREYSPALQQTAIAVGEGAVWVADGFGLLTRIDPRRPSRQRVYRLRRYTNAIATGGGAVWLSAGSPPSVLRVDPRTGKVVATIPIAARSGAFAPFPHAVGVGAGSVWVTNGNTATISRVDLQTEGVVVSLKLALNLSRVAVGSGAVWVADTDFGTILKIDPATNRVVGRVELGGGAHPQDIAVGGGKVWVPLFTLG